MKIEHEFTFEAAHRLELLPEAHKCHNLHGHNLRTGFETVKHIYRAMVLASPFMNKERS